MTSLDIRPAQEVGNEAEDFQCRQCGLHVEGGFIDLAEHYGYPLCCALAFEERAELLDLVVALAEEPVHVYLAHLNASADDRRDGMLRGTGFLPCVTCSLIYSEAELVEVIEAARVCAVPFQADVDRVRALEADRSS